MELLAPEKLEPILFKLLLTDTKYLNLLNSCNYTKEWLSDKDFGISIDMVLKYFTKYQSLPKFSTIDLLLSKLKILEETYKDVSRKIKLANEIDLKKYDSDFLDEQVLKYLKHSGFYWTIMSSIDEIQEKHDIGMYLEKMSKISTLNFDKDLGLDYLENIEEHISYLENPEARLSTGWESLDKYMNGGLLKDGRCLAVFLGETHIGKSLMLSNIAANLLSQNKFVMIISLEMSKDVYGTRIDAHLTTRDINKPDSDSIRKNVECIKLKNDKSKLIIKEFPPDTVTCNHLKTYIDEVVQYYKRTPDIIIIDYINLLLPNNPKSGDSYNKYKEVATQMRALSYIFNTPIVSVSQVNRSGFASTDVGLDKTSESMGIPFTADFVGALWQNEGDREAEILNMKILKNRLGGRIGKNIQYHIDYLNLKISDISQRASNTQTTEDEIFSSIESIEDLV
jgi:KaiC/GvpD/RAD55 family RecA-like ATPase